MTTSRELRWRSFVFAALVGSTLHGCAGEEDPPGLDAPRILELDVSSLSVLRGEPVTLSWQVDRADHVTLSATPGGTLLRESAELEGSFTTAGLNESTTFQLLAVGPGGRAMASAAVNLRENPDDVAIIRFDASPLTIERGDSTTLNFEVENATRVIVTEVGGASLFESTTELSGSLTVSPAGTTDYLLTAEGRGGPTTAMVSVTVAGSPSVLSFSVEPSTVEYGESAELRWETMHATSVEITALGDTILSTTTELSGVWTVTATRTTTYTLRARNNDGEDSATATLTVRVGPPRITAFVATPNPAPIGGTSIVSWSIAGASSVRVEDAMRTAIYDGTAANGSVSVAVTAPSATFTLIAANATGEANMQLTLEGRAPPRIDALVVTPLSFVGTALVDVVYETTDALSTELLIDGVPHPGHSTSSLDGSFSFMATESVELVFRAINAVGAVEQRVRVLRLVDELEPNGDPATAQMIPSGAAVAGRIDGVGGLNGDLDYFAIAVPAGGSLFVEVGDGEGGCNLDAILTLYSTDGTTVIGDDDEDGPGSCPAIDPIRDGFAANLSAGTYYFRVLGFEAPNVGEYVVLAIASPPACGNRILEPGASEQCDDGNQTSGDGCSSTCDAEPIGTVTGPGQRATFMFQATEPGRSGSIRVEMASEGYIFAETLVPARGRCDTGSGSASADTFLTLHDAAFNTLGGDDDDGLGACAMLEPRFDTFARVPAGTYWVRIGETGDDSTLTDVMVEVETIDLGCGNSILEATESCDDGNLGSADGCSPACVFEGQSEVEPNNAFAIGTVLGGSPPFVIEGAIEFVSDVDFFRVDVPAGHHLDAYLTIDSFDTCPSSPTGRVSFFDAAGAAQGGGNIGGGPRGNCGRVWPYTVAQTRALTAGRYGIRVNENGDNAVIGKYYLHVDVIPDDTCGNTIFEGDERCDDGNTTSGDGCSAACLLEPIRTITLPGPSASSIDGSIAPSHDRDAVQLDVSAPVYLRAETFVDAAFASCPAIGTQLRLFSGDQQTELGSNMSDGVDNCSSISAIDAFALLDPGTYVLAVEDNGNNSEIGGYELLIAGIPAHVCGNGVLEAHLAEECDDGNIISADGCSASCRLEP